MSRTGQYKNGVEADTQMQIRIPTYQKELILAAAEKKGLSLSEFVIDLTYAAAQKIMGKKK